MISTPIYRGIAQSDLDMAGFDLLNWSGDGGGSGGTGLPAGTVSVKDAPYSATGDGVTDDTLAIQAAIDAVFALGGGTVFFPKGTYLCNGAFDATTNSVLKFPYRGVTRTGGSGTEWNTPVTIELLGETPAYVAPRPFETGSIIKCTKTGTGTAPSILAAYTYLGRSYIPDFTVAYSYIQAVIRNLHFQTASDPSIGGIRLDSASMMILEDVVVATADTGTGFSAGPGYVEPTHGTVGIWGPGIQNLGRNFCKHVWSMGFDTGVIAADAFDARQVEVLNSHVAVELLSNNGCSIGSIVASHCNTAIKFTLCDATVNKHGANLYLGMERMNTGWQVPTGAEISDPDNVGRGRIRYWINTFEPAAGSDIQVTGGSNLDLVNVHNITTRYIGTDARLVPITGGTKLQVRNPGTGLWADADQWTNP